MVRVRSVVSVLLLIAALPLLAATKPPGPLRRVGDHYTPYNPPDPATFPAGSKVHIIVRGDTLWDLARTYYGNAYLWPQLWEQNTYITDSHWIYPGDPLLVQGESTSAAEVQTSTTSATSATGESENALAETAIADTAGATVPLGTEADIYCYGYLGAVDEPLPNRIASFQDAEMKIIEYAVTQDIGVGEGEIVYVRGGASTGLVAGETYIVVQPAEVIDHPVTGENLGRQYDYRGRIRILCLGPEVATGIVVQSCSDLHIGDALKPMPQLPIPVARLTSMRTVCDPPSGRQGGYIVRAHDYAFALGEGNLVQIDLGRDDSVQPGDFLTVYRDNPIAGYPRLVIGELGVLTTEAKTSTARIVQMSAAMSIGDKVEMK